MLSLRTIPLPKVTLGFSRPAGADELEWVDPPPSPLESPLPPVPGATPDDRREEALREGKVVGALRPARGSGGLLMVSRIAPRVGGGGDPHATGDGGSLGDRHGRL